MNNYLAQKRQKPDYSNDLLKIEALIDLELALIQERYEECAGLIRKARNCGAGSLEVKVAIQEATVGRKKRVEVPFTRLRRF